MANNQKIVDRQRLLAIFYEFREKSPSDFYIKRLIELAKTNDILEEDFEQCLFTNTEEMYDELVSYGYKIDLMKCLFKEFLERTINEI